jgi:hypothetical protein
VGTLGVGNMNSMAFLLLANSSAGIDENQEMELTIGSLSIFIGPSGSTRLSDLVKPYLSVRKPEIVTMMESSEGSSSEVNSPVSVGETQIVRGDEIKLDMEEKALKARNSIKDLAVGGSGISKSAHQLCVIITEAEEENNHEENEEIDKQVDKAREPSKKEKEKIHVSTGNGGSSCQLSIMAQKYPKAQEEKS